jgi:hypothetical protein
VTYGSAKCSEQPPLEVLAGHSLIQLDPSSGGSPARCWRPSARSWPGGWRRAPTPPMSRVGTLIIYRKLTGQADRSLRGADHGEWLEQLEAEAGT